MHNNVKNERNEEKKYLGKKRHMKPGEECNNV